MPSETSRKISHQVIESALSFGASSAGISSIKLLQRSPSYELCGALHWSQDANYVLVLALHHPVDQPELDWWDEKGGSEGDRRLIGISKSVQGWLKEQLDINADPLPYHAEKGGIFLKDAAVLAGLGTIGVNNLLITPNFGPRVRLRALLMDADFAPTGPTEFNPCTSCDKPCLQACPQGAFINGQYHRDDCMKQMEQDIANKNNQRDPLELRIRYCRACELACIFSL